MKLINKTILAISFLFSVFCLYWVNFYHTRFSSGYFCGGNFQYGVPVDPGMSGTICNSSAVVPLYGTHYVNLEVLNIILLLVAVISLVGFIFLIKRNASK